MPRPKLALPLNEVVETYYETGSVRGTAKALGVSRWCIQQRLLEAGITPANRLDAMAQVKTVRPEPVHYRETVEVEQWGDTTTVTTRTLTSYDPCTWPDCDDDATHGAICATHHVTVSQGYTGSCAWPKCPSHVANDDALCTYHRGRASGRLS